MKKIVFIIIFICSITVSTVYAQSGTGCLIGTNLYPDYGGNFFGLWYNDTNSKPTTAPTCPRVQTTSGPGTACRIGLFGFTYGFEYTYITLTAPIGCPIDDYIPHILLLSSTFAVLSIKKKLII